jgi:uncharacterized protein (TIGR00299 family) protein
VSVEERLLLGSRGFPQADSSQAKAVPAARCTAETMRIGYLDCFSGVAGDMWVGALLDAGLDLGDLRDVVSAMELPGVGIRSERVHRCSLVATRFVVEQDGLEIGRAPEQSDLQPKAPMVMGLKLRPAAPVSKGPRKADGGRHVHRRLADVVEVIGRAGLPHQVEQQCLSVFQRIGEVEAKAHGTTIDEVHFHEVGAVDTMVDVVCACMGTHLLGIERLYSSAVEVGSGTVRTAHGELPVPAPATQELLSGLPVRQSGLLGERTTPTGAALLRELVAEFEPRLTWLPGVAGHGAGMRDDPRVPNLLRLTLGDLRAEQGMELVVELSCQVDTATGEHLGWLIDEALARGALDAFSTAVHMKKGRPGHLVSVLCRPGDAAALTQWLLEDSSTLGVRRQDVMRAVLERWSETRETPFGPVRFKVARLPSGATVGRPEDDEVRRLCREYGLSRREVTGRLG